MIKPPIGVGPTASGSEWDTANSTLPPKNGGGQDREAPKTFGQLGQLLARERDIDLVRNYKEQARPAISRQASEGFQMRGFPAPLAKVLGRVKGHWDVFGTTAEGLLENSSRTKALSKDEELAAQLKENRIHQEAMQARKKAAALDELNSPPSSPQLPEGDLQRAASLIDGFELADESTLADLIEQFPALSSSRLMPGSKEGMQTGHQAGVGQTTRDHAPGSSDSTIPPAWPPSAGSEESYAGLYTAPEADLMRLQGVKAQAARTHRSASSRPGVQRARPSPEPAPGSVSVSTASAARPSNPTFRVATSGNLASIPEERDGDI